MHRIIFPLSMCVCVLLAGCYPVIGSYYSPSSAAGIQKSEYCHGSIGAKNTMDMRFGDLELLLSADEIDNSRTHLDLQILGSQESINWSVLSTVGVIGEDDHTELAKKDVKTMCSRVEANGCAYSFDIDTVPEEFSVVLPGSFTGDQPPDPIVVKFVKKSGLWVSTINC